MVTMNYEGDVRPTHTGMSTEEAGGIAGVHMASVEQLTLDLKDTTCISTAI